MTAGMVFTGRLWRYNYSDDDAVGGAVLTGTILYQSFPFSLQEQEEEQLLMQQGLQTIKTFTAVCPMIIEGELADIRERDEIEILTPPNHPHAGDYFRVTNPRFSSHAQNDARAYIMLSLIRSERAHTKQ
jgi:hypothetical protein